MLQAPYGLNGLEEHSAIPAEYQLAPCQHLNVEHAPAITAYIDTLPHGLIADEL